MPRKQTLRTARLAMRWLTHGDEPLLLAIWNDPAFVRYVGDRGIRTLDQAGKRLDSGPMALYAEHGYGPYRVALAESDEPVGICGLFKREFLDAPDIGCALLPDSCGKGFAYEASIAVMNHARLTLGLRRLTAIVSPENTASLRLVDKLGLDFEGMVTEPEEGKELRLYSVHWSDGG